MALNYVVVAVTISRAVPQNYIINGASKRTRSGDATGGEFRPLKCVKRVFNGNYRVSVVLGGPRERDNDSRLACYFNIDSKVLLVILSGELHCIPAATGNEIRFFINAGVSKIVKDRMIGCMNHLRKLGQVIEVICRTHWGLNLHKLREKNLFRENRCLGSVNLRSFSLESLQVIGMWFTSCACRSPYIGCRKLTIASRWIVQWPHF